MKRNSVICPRNDGAAIRALPFSAQLKTGDTTFYDRLSQAVERVPPEARKDLQGLCRMLHGAFPNDVVQALGSRLISGFQKPSRAENRSELDQRSPEPHPIDYDWRFNKATADSLARLTSSFGRVLCIGTPTVYHAIAERRRAGFLIDRNPFLACHLVQNENCNFIIENIEALSPNDIDGQFAAAILDPPWYPAVYERWLARTIPHIQSGGTIFVSLFRKFTRPEAERERLELLDRFAAIGEVSFAFFEAVYSTPRFEAEVLSRLNLPVLPDWRAADVVRIDLFPHITSWPFPCHPAESTMLWHRFLDDQQVIAVVYRDNDRGPITYSPAAPNISFELASVSGRDPGRTTIAVWTSRNRAAAATGTQRIIAVFCNHDSSIAKNDRASVHPVDERVTAHLANDLKFAF